ncbi:hypothetical protein ABZS66_24110 [Dactylosporangium sp. NPDC005572]|uniref:hypothetical protein n=1 Tax=Dactylosporangium sp. NPDC005572 TaxID=3156889 RepID=UPI0033B28E95
MKARVVIAAAIGFVASVAAGVGTYGIVNLGDCEATGNCRLSFSVVMVAFIGGSALAVIAVLAGGGLRLMGVLFTALAAGAIAAAVSGNELGWLLGGIFLLVGFGIVAAAVHTRRVTREAGARMRAAFAGTRETLTGPGLPAAGTVLSVSDTGTTVNDDPLAMLRLRVEPADGSAAFEAVATRLVSRLAAPRPGDRFAVEYDPADPTRLAVREALPAEPGHA